MGRILYLKFLGARAIQEAKKQDLSCEKPLAILERDLVLDCNEKAWDDGVRPGDTLRQARIASPMCRVLRVGGIGGEHLEDILEALAKISPYIEPSPDQNGVFVDIPHDSAPEEILDLLGGLYFCAFAGLSSSKLVSRAVCDLLMKEYLGRGKVSAGNTLWGSVRYEASRSAPQREGQEGEDGGRTGSRVVAVVTAGREKAFLAWAPLDSLWMAPTEILSALKSLGLKKVRDLREVPVSALAEHIGDWAYMVKRWADGEERSRVQALYPPPTLSREVNFIEPVPLQKELFHGVLKDLAACLIEKGVGFKTLRLSLSADFQMFSGNPSGERKFVRPVASLDVMRAAVDAIVESILKDISPDSVPAISGFSIELGGIAPVQAKPSPLFHMDAPVRPKAIPVALKLTLFGLEEKFGDRAVTWGKRDAESERFDPEIIRREKMLAIWDPMRPPVFEEPVAPGVSVGGIADV